MGNEFDIAKRSLNTQNERRKQQLKEQAEGLQTNSRGSFADNGIDINSPLAQDEFLKLDEALNQGLRFIDDSFSNQLSAINAEQHKHRFDTGLNIFNGITKFFEGSLGKSLLGQLGLIPKPDNKKDDNNNAEKPSLNSLNHLTVRR